MKEKFNNDPEAYDKYCRDLEGELNKRFTLVRASLTSTKKKTLTINRCTSKATTKNNPALSSPP